jgi:hypothetical protein
LITLNTVTMNRLLFSILFLLITSAVSAQVIGRVVKKTKEFYVPSDLKIEYRVFGYEMPNATSQKMICFSSYRGDVNDNYNKCPLGSYYDTGRMHPGDKISFIKEVNGFARMLYVTATGKKSIFYLPRNAYEVK